MATGKRIASVDALRGFDMFFISGGALLIGGICSALGMGECWLARQMHHVEWVGFHHHDTIFPLFLFLAGVSWPFSLASQRARGKTSGQIHAKILFRTAALFLIGLSFGGILKFSPTFRLMSVLGFIGISWGLAALAYMHIRRLGARLALVGALLAGQYVLLRFFGIAPDAPAGTAPYDYTWNIVFYFDRMLWEGHMLWKGFEPESVFAVANGVALALLGMLAGTLLVADRWTASRKSGLLTVAAVASGLLAALMAYVAGDPLIKQLWTTSFVLAAASYSFALLALFHWIVDVRGWTGWTVLFDPVGKNSILVYTLAMMGVVNTLDKFFFTGVIEHAGAWSVAVKGLTLYLITWFVAWWCKRRGIFLKV